MTEARLDDLDDLDVERVLDTLRSGWLTMGPRIQELEAAFAAHAGAGHAVAVSSGTAALHLACVAAGVDAGGEVLVPALGSLATAAAVRAAGGTPVAVDVGEAGLVVEPAAVERLLSERTRAVVAVHLLGVPAPVEALRRLCDERGVVLVEDCAHAAGAEVAAGRRAGTVGHLGCFSLAAGMHIGVGEGGLVVCADEALAARVRLLRSHAMTSVTWDRHRGHATGYDVVDVGFNFRLDEPRAALALSRLVRLDAELEQRRAALARHRDALDAQAGARAVLDDEALERGGALAVPLLAPDRDARDRLRAALEEAGAGTVELALLSDAPWVEGEGCRHAEALAGRLCAVALDAAGEPDPAVVARALAVAGAAS